MFDKLLGPILGVIDRVFDSVLPSGTDKATAEKMKAEAKMMLVDASIKEDGEFRQFILEYEGRAKDMPAVIQIVRSLIRPVVTVGVIAATLWCVFTMTEIPTTLNTLDIIVAGFWFGEKAAVRFMEAKK